MGVSDLLSAPLFGAGPRVHSPAPFSILAVEGPDAVEFLQRLCSQDVRSMAPGAAAPLAFLDAKGKLVATGWALRGADQVFIETAAEQADGLLALLDRYHFSERLTLARRDGECVGVVTRGASARGAAEAPEDSPDGLPWSLPAGSWREAAGVLEVCHERHGVRFVRCHGPAAALPTPPGEPLTDAEAEAVRILTGQVRVGVDTEKTTLGPEAHLDDAIVVSETKGCYTGQEIVARIQTYGHVNRGLCLLRIEGEGEVPLDTPLLEPEDGAPVGRVKSVVTAHGVRVGLGYLPRDFWEAGVSLRLGAPDGPIVHVDEF